MTVRENVNLKFYTTFGIGGDAKFFVVAINGSDVSEALTMAREKNLPVFILGGGSNILVSDEGFPGVVIKNEILGFEIHGREVEIGAGEIWDTSLARCLENDLQGIECLSGIPGTVGGAVVQNIGAYGQTLARVVELVEVIDLDTLETKVFKKDECEFEYRNSIFKKNPGKYCVTKLTLKLNYGGIPDITYPSVAKRFEGTARPPITEVRQAVIDIRAEKGMVILPGYEVLKSAGSYFKNPIVTKKKFEEILHMISCPDPWHWAEGPDIKVSAACLITQAGFSKGQMIGKAQISPFQPLAIINPDGATAEDIKFTANHIRHRVLDKFGIELTEEIVYIDTINASN
ncbi:MAG: UDP-N-acetylmuramate dehydrogenase [Candidatus Doudnabacteria bacterium]|nr:UDP-N-acetylmuramate dehydrogenase [Candidatus Doudnabacteria bacterium]